MNTLLFEERENGLGILKIHRPKALNALNSEVLEELDAFLDGPEMKNCRGLILTGEGPKAFAAGADIREMSSLSPKEGEAFGKKGNAVFRKLEKLPVPVIAAVNGYALGGGCELAMSCDLILCSENAVFGQPETGLGITPGFGGTQRLMRRIGIQPAKELIYTGRNMKAPEALEKGLVLKVVPGEELLPEAEKLLNRILKNSGFAVGQSKKAMNLGADLPLEEALALESVCFGECFGCPDQKERMENFLNR